MKATKTIMIVGVCAIALASAVVLAGAVGTAFTYQGQLKEDGAPANGDYDLMFTLFDQESDGDQVGDPVEVLEHTITNGLFTVQLDFGAGVFDGQALWLEVAVRPYGTSEPHTTLSPRQPLAAAPYAMYALGGPGGTGEYWAGSGADIFNTNAGRVGVGTDVPEGKLHVVTSDEHGVRVNTNYIGVLAYRDSTTGTWPAIHGECSSQANGSSGVRGKLTAETPGASAAGIYGFVSSTGSNGAGVRGYHSGSGKGVLGEVANSDGYAGYFVGGRNYFNGPVGIGVSDPDSKLHVFQPSTTKPALHLYTKIMSQPLPIYGHMEFAGTSINAWNTFVGGSLALNNSVDENVNLVGGGGEVTIGPYPYTITLDPNDGSNGARITMNDDEGVTTVFIDSQENITSAGGVLELRNEYGVSTVRLDGQSWANAGVIDLKKGDGNYGIIMYAETLPYRGGSIVLKNSSGHGAASTIFIDADKYGDGRGWVIASEMQTDILHILGGSDLSEQFDVKEEDDEIVPGMVVSIDPTQPGKLTVSREAYDRKVAGIISGAGGVDTGLMMGQSGSIANGDYPVALTGRVYCLCDASNGAVQPGDLLTTADLPGHAMKVRNHAKAQGAIIGKAMTSLENAQGLVLVLVSLQ